jgi:hypothetical protein
LDGIARTSDYIAKTGTLTFAPGETTNPDPSGFTKSRGLGTILNDD